MMEWCYGLDVEDFNGRTDQEMLDMFPPPDSWSQQWETSESQRYGSTGSSDPEIGTSLPIERKQGKMVFGKSNGQSFLQETEDRNGFNCRNTMTHDHADIQDFSDLTWNDQMDDMFLSMPTDDDATDFMFGSESNSSIMQNAGTSKKLMSPSLKWETSCVSNNTSFGTDDQSLQKASDSKVFHPSYQNHSNGSYDNNESECIDGGISAEESVLHDLELTLTQLSSSTRLCFRDSLYRLAHNSFQQTALQNHAGGHATDDPSEIEAVDERIRSSGETEAGESETNTIDRAVANFMFKKADGNTQSQT